MARPDCLHPTVLRFDKDSINVLSEESVLNYDEKEQVIVGYHGENTASKWYEFIANYDFTLSFKIWSDNFTSKYGFFIYRKGNGKFFCEELARGRVKPLEAIIYKEEIGLLGIGTLPSVNPELDDTSKHSRSEMFYQIPYKNAITACKGDTFYLNIYRYSGEDCGHHIWITAGENTTKLRCINKSCGKVRSLKMVDVVPFYDSTEYHLKRYMLELNRPKPFLAIIEVTDSLSGKPVQAQLYNGSDRTYSNKRLETDGLGQKSMSFSQDTTILIHNVGYHPKIVRIERNGKHVQQVKLRKLARGEQFVLEHIYFAANSNRILLSSKAEIEKLARFLTDNPSFKIKVLGHTNGQSKIKKDRHLKNQFHGTEKKLSRKRAKSVKQELNKLGINKARIKTKGYGGEKMLYPIPGNALEHDRNKRVEVLVL